MCAWVYVYVIECVYACVCVCWRACARARVCLSTRVCVSTSIRVRQWEQKHRKHCIWLWEGDRWKREDEGEAGGRKGSRGGGRGVGEMGDVGVWGGGGRWELTMRTENERRTLHKRHQINMTSLFPVTAASKCQRRALVHWASGSVTRCAPLRGWQPLHRWPSVKASASRARQTWVRAPAFSWGLFRGRVIPVILTRRANAQTIHIRHTYRTFSQSSLLHNPHEHVSCFMQLYNRMTLQVLVFSWPCDLEWISRSFKLKSHCRVQQWRT